MIDIIISKNHEHIIPYKAENKSRSEVAWEKFGDIFIAAYEKRCAGAPMASEKR